MRSDRGKLLDERVRAAEDIFAPLNSAQRKTLLELLESIADWAAGSRGS